MDLSLPNTHLLTWWELFEMLTVTDAAPSVYGLISRWPVALEMPTPLLWPVLVPRAAWSTGHISSCLQPCIICRHLFPSFFLFLSPHAFWHNLKWQTQRWAKGAFMLLLWLAVSLFSNQLAHRTFCWPLPNWPGNGFIFILSNDIEKWSLIFCKCIQG